MRKTIDQFMWGFQPHFRRSLESLTQTMLRSIGAAADPRVFLIGFINDETGKYPICIEPETGPFAPSDLATVLSDASATYKEHPDADLLHTDPGQHEQFHQRLLDDCRAQALSASLEAAGEQNRLFFVGRSGIIGSYRVFPAVGVIKSRWRSLPALSKKQKSWRVSTQLSLQDSVVEQALMAASRALYEKDPPQGLPFESPDELIRRASIDFVDRLVFVHGEWFGQTLYASMSALAAQPYEGRTGVGTVVLGRNSTVDVEIKFREPIEIRKIRSFRKALEMTGTNLHLLSDGVVAYGLGKRAAGYDEASESCFDVQVIGRGQWELTHLATPLMRVDNGKPELPVARLSRDHLLDAVTRIFPESQNAEALWSLAETAARQVHGTMVVVRSNAADEATRLAPQALAIDPQELSTDTLLAVTAIDGAVLVDPEARCHAVGVILDGVALEGAGDPSRGARYNSAVRYVEGAGSDCLVIIVSEDGMINLLPSLPRRVHRSAVEAALAKVEDAVGQDVVDFEEFFRHEEHLRSISFYLSAEQCERANKARESLEALREKSGSAITRVNYSSFQPDPKMNDSYLLDE